MIPKRLDQGHILSHDVPQRMMQWASHCLENHSRQTQRIQLRWLHWCHSDQCPRVTGATERKNTWKNEGTAKLGLVFWRPTGGSLFFGITFFNLFIICFPTIVDSFYILLEIIKYIYIYYIIPLNIFELISVFSIVGSLGFFAAEPAKEHDLEGLLDLLRVVKVLGDELPQRKGRPSPTWYPDA